MSLEPGKVLLVEPPTLTLQFLRREILLVSALLIIKYKEQRVRVKLEENISLSNTAAFTCGKLTGVFAGVAR